MEDFGFNLQDIKDNFSTKRITKIIISLISFFISILILFLIIKLFKTNKHINIDKVRLIESKVKEIKIKPEMGNNSNVELNIFDLIDEDEQSINPLVKKTKNLDVSSHKHIIIDQNSLKKKIEEINDIEHNNQNDNITKDTEDDKKNKIIYKKTNSNANINELEKLGNKSLISNLKKKKYIKPGIRIQLMALQNKTKLIDFWDSLQEQYPKLFSEKNYYIEEIKSYNNMIYRLQIGTFLDKKEAKKFCQDYISIANKNKADCIILED